MSFDKSMSYTDYLSLDLILGAQNCRSDAHDGMLFILQHQTSELWMRLCLHELTAARNALIQSDLQSSFKTLARVARIFDQLNNAWDVLRTMTPSEYTEFRNDLARTIHETPSPFTRPFVRSGFREGAEYRLYFRVNEIRYGRRGCGGPRRQGFGRAA